MSSEDSVRQIMSKTVRTVDSDSSLDEVVKLMIKHEIGSILVTQGTKPIGIITERDVVRRLAKGTKSMKQTAGQAASKPLITVDPETPMWEAFTMLLRNKIRRLPVMKGGKLLGIVTERDLFKWVVRVSYEPDIPAEILKLIAQNQ